MTDREIDNLATLIAEHVALMPMPIGLMSGEREAFRRALTDAAHTIATDLLQHRRDVDAEGEAS